MVPGKQQRAVGRKHACPELQAWHTECYFSSKACYTVAAVSGLRHLPMAIL
ncbi:hypothetical protein Plim_2894 [Planctopirus limnophila DSM 3776]|uniref:Uncharacterized protein n=1 Tax=Planctopirus limnophila (strain ATCC 43296 / DSM 3776 / IFAM 1008 / Mu 290) TaxID=521674 RepID=D5SRZ2_PLAL2|nr:hypothetical protein Plim_2894 [Planctopirus limnophila DSM 3776]